MAEAMVSIVTGGEKGIGRAIVERLRGDGWKVVVAGMDEKAAYFLQRDYYGDKELHFVPCDVASEKSVRLLFQLVATDFGRLDGLVLNSGTPFWDRVDLTELKIEQWRSVLEVNLTGPFLCAKHGSGLLKQSGGSIVAVASPRSLASEPDTFAHSASRGGLVSLSRCLAMSLGPEVRVNSVSPGWIHHGDYSDLSHRDHEQHPVGRVGHPDDIAGLVGYLVGPESGFVTGQDFVVDGGMTKKMVYER